MIRNLKKNVKSVLTAMDTGGGDATQKGEFGLKWRWFGVD